MKTILIHGCGSKDAFLSLEGKLRCNVAVELAQTGDAIILMGGITKPFQTQTEAQLMREFISAKLKNEGVYCYLLLEGDSCTTIDNAERALSLYEPFIATNELIAVTSDYHGERTRSIWMYLLNGKNIAMESARSSFMKIIKSCPVEIIGLLVAFLYFHGITKPEYIFRNMFRTPVKS